MGKQRRNRAQWQQVVEDWQRSGLSQQAYCERQGISLSSLQRWLQRVRQAQGAAPKVVRLVPVDWVAAPTPAAADASGLTLVLSGGWRLEVTGDFDATTLRRLLAVLREAA